MALATFDDVAARLGRPVADSEVERVDALLEDVSASVRSYTGQTFDAEETTVRAQVRNGVVVLTQRPVTAVSTVLDVNGNEVTFTWLGSDRIQVGGTPLNAWELVPYVNGLQVVDVTYEHGYEATPPDVLAVVCQVVGRALGRPSDSAGITQESIEGYSYTLGSAAGAGPLGFLPDERAVLDRYRRVGSTARVG